MAKKLQNLHDAELALRPFVPLVAQLTGKDTTLARIEPLMVLLGNPEQRLRIIHVAGTSGKTSTSYYMAALLQSAGKKVGLTVSPHIDKISERVQIHGLPLADDEFCAELEVFLHIVEQAVNKPSYFELLYAFALWVFARHGVDYAVVETGMGGLHDATNVAQRADKICIITDIGYDHMHVLGNTLAEIAAQKIGIVHQGNKVFCYGQAPEIMQVFRKQVSLQSAQLQVFDAEQTIANNRPYTGGLPDYQKRNWSLAFEVFKYLANRDDIKTLNTLSIKNSLAVKIPARMEIIRSHGKQIIMDGAHNQQKMTAFIASFQALFPTIRPAVLVALKTSKEYQAVSPLLAQLSDTVIVTAFDTTQDLPAQSTNPDTFAASLSAAGVNHVQVVPDLRLAYDTLMNTEQQICVVTGSFYLISQLRTEIML